MHNGPIPDKSRAGSPRFDPEISGLFFPIAEELLIVAAVKTQKGELLGFEAITSIKPDAESRVSRDLDDRISNLLNTEDFAEILETAFRRQPGRISITLSTVDLKTWSQHCDLARASWQRQNPQLA